MKKNGIWALWMCLLLLLPAKLFSQSVGIYPASSVIAGQSVSISPAAAPSGVTALFASAPFSFKGQLMVNPVTGVLRVINANPAGTYAIQVRSGASILQTFTLTVTNSSCAPISFPTSTNISISSLISPKGIFTCDFNNDGITDMASYSFSSTFIAILLGNGNGTFTTSYITVAVAPSSINTADVNGDGFSDLLVSISNAAGNTAVYLSNGNGTFQLPAYYNLSGTTGILTTGDVNNDGAPDILIVGNNRVFVLLNNGNGTFTSGTPVVISGAPSGIIVNDFNNDGNVDFSIFVANITGVKVYFGNGAGLFPTSATLATGFIVSFSTGDVNHDGNADIVCIGSSPGIISCLGNGAGTFNNVTSTLANGASNLILTDLTGDGYLDVALTINSTSSFTTLVNNGSGSFISRKDVLAFATLNNLASADLNSDGYTDLIGCPNVNPGLIYFLPAGNIGMNVQGNAINIPDGSSSTSTTNNTDFGIFAAGYTVSKSFVIQNKGGAPLVVNGIAFSGTGSADFSSLTILPVTISVNGTSTFTINSNSATSGIHNAVAHVMSSDCASADYDFAIRDSIYIATLGTYPATTITSGQSLSITPSPGFAGTYPSSITASNGFNGILTIDPNNGVVRVTNARPAGKYTITIRRGPYVSTSFTLQVIPGLCSNGNMFIGGTMNAGTDPNFITTGDFNGDNREDLIVTNYNSSTASIFLKNASTGFTQAADVSLSTNPKNVAIADFNNDGIQDFAAPSFILHTVDIRFGNGNGTFTAGPGLSVIGNDLSYVATSDFNNDGNVDIVVAYSGKVTCYLGDGAGNFTTAGSVTIGGPIHISVTDFNKDGKSDIVITNNSGGNSIYVRLGNGDGTFSGSTTFGALLPRSTAVGDFNYDGNPDIVYPASNSNQNSIAIQFGNGAGGFTGPTEYSVQAPNYLYVGNFNSDTLIDIAVVNATNILYIFFGLPTAGTFYPSRVGLASTPSSIAIGDMNSDGYQDVASTFTNSSIVNVYYGQYAGPWVISPSTAIADGDNSPSLSDSTEFGNIELQHSVSHNFNIQNEGTDSVMISSITFTGPNAADFSISNISTPTGAGLGILKNFTINLTPQSLGSKTATIHLINDDCLRGDYDFVIHGTAVQPVLGLYSSASVMLGNNVNISPSLPPVGVSKIYASTSPNFKGSIKVNPVTGVIKVFNAQPAGTYTISLLSNTGNTAVVTLTVNNPPCSQAVFGLPLPLPPTSNLFNNAAVVGDFNNDGYTDLIHPNYFGGATFYLGNSTGDFTTGTTIFPSLNFWTIAAADINGDGYLDFVTSNINTSQITVCLGDSTGNFTVSDTINNVSGINKILLLDFNNDNKADIVFNNSQTTNLSVRFGDGAGMFTGSTNITVGINSLDIINGDFNNDGKADLLSLATTNDRLDIILGNGTGGVLSQTTAVTSSNPSLLAVGEFTGDGKQDILVSNEFDNTVSLFTGNGSGSFTRTNIPAGTRPWSMTVSDYNGDGKSDFITDNYSTGTLTVFLNNGSGSFVSKAIGNYSTTRNAIVFSCDLNNDGIVDVLASSEYSESTFKGKLSGVNLSGNNSDITNGSTTTTYLNNTDFETVQLNLPIAKTFTVQNNGADTLIINSIVISGVNASEFSLANISIPAIVTGGTVKSFNIVFTPTSMGNKTAVVHVNYTECTADDYDFVVTGNGSVMSIGNYPSATVVEGQSVQVTPNAAPVNSPKFFITTSTKFLGTFTMDTLTGRIRILNAKPSGVYTVKVSTLNHVSTTFQLTVQPPLCSQANFKPPVITSLFNPVSFTTTGDFNNDGITDLVYLANSTNVVLGNGAGGYGLRIYLGGGFTNSALVSDFDLDGNQDILVGEAGTVRLQRGAGNGTFTSSVAGTFTNGGYEVAAGDINLDGKPDFISPNRNTVAVRLGDGNGGFTQGSDVVFSLNEQINNALLDDYNNDGKLDIAAISYNNNLYLRLGDGLGNFTGTFSLSLGQNVFNPRSMVSADFNRDNFKDIVLLKGTTDGFYYLENSGSVNGGFFLSSGGTLEKRTKFVTTGDFNGDTYRDIAFVNDSLNLLTVYLNSSYGDFSMKSKFTVPAGAKHLHVIDLNNDGIEDFISSNETDGSYSFLYGAKSGISVTDNLNNPIDSGSTTPSLTNHTDFGNVLNGVSNSVTFAVNNSGADTLTVSNITFTGANASEFSKVIQPPFSIVGAGSKSFQIFCTPTSNGIRTATMHINYLECSTRDYAFDIRANSVTPQLGNYPTTTLYAGQSIAVIPDSVPVNAIKIRANTGSAFKGILTADPLSGKVLITNAQPAGNYTVTVISGTVSKTFSLVVKVPQCNQAVFNYSTIAAEGTVIKTADFNKDGNLDIISPGVNGFTIFQGNGAGIFTPVLVPTAVFYSDIAIDDINSDGKQDVLAIGNNSVDIYLGNGNGSFSSAPSIGVTSPVSIAVGNFNNDNYRDFIVASGIFGTIYLGDGNGNFNSMPSYSTGVNILDFAVSDFNNDQLDDVAMACAGSIRVWQGSGNGFLSTYVSYSASPSPTTLETGDFNNDNKQDIIFGYSQFGNTTLSKLFGNGNGTFNFGSNTTVGGNIYSLASGNFNSDGNLDFVSGNYNTNNISIGLGSGTGSFTVSSVPFGSQNSSVIVGDLNNDGLEDIASINQNFHTLNFAFAAKNNISVSGNGNPVTDGSTVVSLSNNTDYGQNPLNTPVPRSFTISNSGTAPLTVTAINLTGANAGNFVVSGLAFPSTISPGGTQTFTLTFTIAQQGVCTATVNVISNDCKLDTFDFAVSGTGPCNTTSITNCPSNIVMNLPFGACSSAVGYIVTAVNDTLKTYQFSGATTGSGSGTGSNSIFNSGTTHVTVTAANNCSSQQCNFDVVLNPNVSDNNACTIDGCDSLNHVYHSPVVTDDANVCTIDGCNTVNGIFHNLIDPDDGIACTVDVCDPVTGISNTPVNTDDGNACTIDDCDNGTGLISHTPVYIDDNDVCTIDYCDTISGVISHNSLIVDDQNVCTIDGCDPILLTATHVPVLTDDGIAFTEDGCDPVTGVYHHPVFNVKLYLEGYYSGNGLMDNEGYGGNLYLAGYSNNPDDADTIQLSLYDMHTFAFIASSKGILKTNGWARFEFNTNFFGKSFLQVRHRTALETWSSVVVTLSNNNSYDFTDSPTKAFGSNETQTSDLAYWALYSGDITNAAMISSTQDGIIDNADLVRCKQAVDVISLGYVPEDITGDIVVEAKDYIIESNNWLFLVFTIHP